MKPQQKSHRGYGVLTLGAVAALLSATARPTEKTLDALIGAGAPELAARALLHAAPVVLIVGALVLGRAVGRNFSQAVRWSIYAVLGGFSGFGMAFCVDLFAGVPDLVTRFVGPLEEATQLDGLMYILAAYCIVAGLMVGAIALGGRGAMSAIQVEAADPECLEVRKNDRRMFAWSSFGMVTLGLACWAVTVSRLAGDDAKLASAAVAAVFAAASIWANWVLWRQCDEMQRRHVVEGYAVSGVAATLISFAWIGLEALGRVPPLDAVGVFLILMFVQILAVSVVTTRAMSQTALFGKPA